VNFELKASTAIGVLPVTEGAILFSQRCLRLLRNERLDMSDSEQATGKDS